MSAAGVLLFQPQRNISNIRYSSPTSMNVDAKYVASWQLSTVNIPSILVVIISICCGFLMLFAL